jgi:hypothetical protein
VAPTPEGTARQFPLVVARTLLGEELTLPGDLPAARTLAVVAFRQWQQGCVDRWIAEAVEAGVPATPRSAPQPMDTAVVELPVLSTRWRPVRRFIDGGMTSGIGHPDVLARTATVYTDVGAFQRALGIPGSDEVHALVVTRDGAILARAHGEPTEESWAPLRAALA